VRQFMHLCARSILGVVLLGGVISPVHAQISNEVTHGLQWLTSQVQSDGSLLNEHQSIATVFQNRTEVAQTLKLLATPSPSLIAGISADTEDNTEYLSRKVNTLAINGAPTNVYTDMLIQRQNTDGGFGGSVGYESNALDSAWAAAALSQANNAMGAQANTNNFLLSQIGTDGCIAVKSDINCLQASALALLALQTTSDNASTTAARNLTTWISQQQTADGSWLGSTYLTALTLASVAQVTPENNATRANAKTFLLSQQASNGSWNTA
jgi:prenyltransferase beta subunit